MKQTKKISHKKPIRKRTFRKQTRNVHKKSRNKSYKKIKGGDAGAQLRMECGYGKGNVVTVAKLLQDNTGIWGSSEIINAKNNYGSTPLHLACENGHIGVTKLLLEKGADVNASNNYGSTPLHLACESKTLYREKIVDFLISKNADINASDKNGNTPLHLACIEGYLIEVIALTKAGADVNAKGRYGNTPLHVLCKSNYKSELIKIIKTLVDENNANVNLVDDYGNTPLHIACGEEKKRIIVNLLIMAGANVNAEGADGNTPLHIACEKCNNSSIEQLVNAKGVDVNVKNTDGQTPLYIACGKCKIVVVEFLIEKGADLNACVLYEEGNMGVFRREFTYKIVHFLANDVNSKDMNLIDTRGMMPLHIACNSLEDETSETIIKLIEKGADVTSKIVKGNRAKTPMEKLNEMGKGNGKALDETPLSIVCKKGDTVLLKLIINTKEKVDSNSIDPKIINLENEYQTFNKTNQQISVKKMTPLHYAARYGTLEQVKFLIEKGADVKAEDSNSWTPLQHACGRSRDYRENVEVTQTLIEKMEKAERNRVLKNNYCHRTKMNLSSSFKKKPDSQISSSYSEKAASFGRNIRRMVNYINENDVDREIRLIDNEKWVMGTPERERERERERDIRRLNDEERSKYLTDKTIHSNTFF